MRLDSSGQAILFLLPLLVIVAAVILELTRAADPEYTGREDLQHALALQAADLVRANLVSMGRHRPSWTTSMMSAMNNGSTDCLRPPGSFCPAAYSEVALLLPTNTVFFDGRTASPINGFNLNGEICLASSPECFGRVRVEWAPGCVGGCVNPSEIVMRLSFSPVDVPGLKRSINYSRFDVMVKL